MKEKKIPQSVEKNNTSTQITVEDFLFYYNKAFEANNAKASDLLCDRYPEIAKIAFDADYIEKKSDAADKELNYPYPILLSTSRLTERRVLNIVSYLLCQIEDMPPHYKHQLRKDVAYTYVFNYSLDRYQRDYDPHSLWNDFFLRQETLSKVIAHRHISNLEDLIYRSIEYFDALRTNGVWKNWKKAGRETV